MKIYSPLKYCLSFIFSLLTCVGFFSTFTIPAYALPAEHYASNSVLAEGKWVRINIPSTGMHLISSASLKAMGFSDITKVNAYGTGGRQIRVGFHDATPDDLPMLPTIHTAKGIAFYATDNTTWMAGNSNMPYSHSLNPYTVDSWIYLSDRPIGEELSMSHRDAPGPNGPTPETIFYDRILHEKESEAPEETGNDLFGEDFRTQSSQSFPFKLRGVAEGEAIVRVRFGAQGNARSSFQISANGTNLGSENFNAAGEKTYAVDKTITASIKNPSENLSIDVKYNPAGIVKFARLDYIEVAYPRHLRMDGASLLFHFNLRDAATAELAGCSSSTRIWDVTDPWNPVEVGITFSGDRGRIALPQGYHEYVAFDAENLTATTTAWERVRNQNIHAVPTPEMVIITFDAYANAANRIAELHRKHDGMTVEVVSADDIFHEFGGGNPEPGAFRRMLKMWHDRGGDTLKYCLLMGRPFFDHRLLSPAGKALRYRPMPIWASVDAFTETTAFSTDGYLAMLDDCNDNLNVGNFPVPMAIAVGRLPVKSTSEADAYATKLENYRLKPDYGSWRNRVMMIADDIDNGTNTDSPISTSSIFFDQAESVRDILMASPGGKSYNYERVYLDAHRLEYTGSGACYPTAKAKMMKHFNDGVVFTNYLGHASPTAWTADKLLEWNDINSFTNKNLTFLFGGTCSFAYWDCSTVSGGEVLLLNPTAGTIGMIMPSRAVWINGNYATNAGIAREIFNYDDQGRQLSVGEAFRRGMNAYRSDNSLKYCLISDPALKLPLPTRSVEISSINGKTLSDDPADFPVIPALGKVSVEGFIANPDGTADESFNGIIDLTLYDAETVVETSGLGRGLERTFNERSSRLTSIAVKVEKGHWKTTLSLPAEIANNFSPALISSYAWDNTTGNEAHGRCESLYVYGFDANAPEDKTPPQITDLYLNSKTFQPGGVVNTNPILFAKLFDASGINISDAAIGHQLSLTLDGTKIFTDLNGYFTTDPEKEGAGSLCYPLENLTPGKHTLLLTVWDNANNQASSEIEFNVGAALDPVITGLGTNVNPASTSVIFTLTLDRPNTNLDCELDVFDLSGRKVWSNHGAVTTNMESTTSMDWDLRDTSGTRVPRGIYLYRATVRTPEGTWSSQTRKLAVTAQ